MVTLNDGPSKDPEILEQRKKLGDSLQNNIPLSRAVSQVLEREIDQRGLLAFESESIFDVPAASTLNFHDKVYKFITHIYHSTNRLHQGPSFSQTYTFGAKTEVFAKNPTPDSDYP